MSRRDLLKKKAAAGAGLALAAHAGPALTDETDGLPKLALGKEMAPKLGLR